MSCRCPYQGDFHPNSCSVNIMILCSTKLFTKAAASNWPLVLFCPLCVSSPVLPLLWSLKCTQNNCTCFREMSKGCLCCSFVLTSTPNCCNWSCVWKSIFRASEDMLCCRLRCIFKNTCVSFKCNNTETGSIYVAPLSLIFSQGDLFSEWDIIIFAANWVVHSPNVQGYSFMLLMWLFSVLALFSGV